MTTSSPASTAAPADSTDLRQLAIGRLRKRRELQAHLLAYVMVSLFLNAIWFLTNPGGFYWPMFPMFGWGIGVAFHIWNVYSPEDPPEERIDREMQRLRGPKDPTAGRQTS